MLKVFLNHASEDRALVLPYFEKLKALGYEPWIDKNLLPGQDWDEEIQRAFNAADVILVFMSPRSVVKRGYVQREINDALDRQRTLLQGDIGLIPLMLEQCEVPTKIARIVQYINVPEHWHKVIEALELAARQRSIAINTGVEIGPFRMFIREEKNEWEGAPGYDVSLRYPHVESTRLSNTALELNDLFSSLRLNYLLDARQARVEQEEGFFSGWTHDSDWKPRNTFDHYIYPGLVSDSILSFGAHESGMHAGAAHGFNWIETYNFLILDDSLVKITFLDFLKDGYAALTPITELLREKIVQEWRERLEEEPDQDSLTTISEALTAERETYDRFQINQTGLTLIFPQGMLFAHALGAFGADFSFEELRQWLKPGGPHTLAKIATVASVDTGDAEEPA